MFVLLYLTSIVAANQIIARFGPQAAVVTAFFFIALDLTCRDKLHDQWHARNLKAKMFTLIASGSVLSWLVNAGAGRIALASFVAFALSEITDTLVYSRLLRHDWLVRSNGSNLASAAVDSLVFPVLAFGAFLPLVIVGQFLAKTLGGALWSVVLKKYALAGAAVSVLLVLTPSRADAQFGNIGAGVLGTGAGAHLVSELFVSSPSVLGLRANAVASWDFTDGSASYFTKVGRGFRFSNSIIGVEAGADWLSFRGHKPEPIVNVFASAPLAWKFRINGIVSMEPMQSASLTSILKLELPLFFRR